MLSVLHRLTQFYFYPRPPRGGRPPSAAYSATWMLISIHALREEGDIVNSAVFCYTKISIHALREEGDMVSVWALIAEVNFYPRPPRGGRPNTRPLRSGSGPISIHALREEGDSLLSANFPPRLYFYPRPPRGGRLASACQFFPFTPISIHALREEGDFPLIRWQIPTWAYFYPRPPRGGRQSLKFAASQDRQFLSTPSARRATLCPSRCGLASGFLSTPSARRATFYFLRRCRLWTNFYPRPPRGGRLEYHFLDSLPQMISIHALREEGDKLPLYSLSPS